MHKRDYIGIILSGFLAGLIADCVLNGTPVKEKVRALRSGYTSMRYCFDDAETGLEKLLRTVPV